jgi:hypothetical protein
MVPTIHVAVMTPHTDILITKGYFKSLSQINTAPEPTVLSTDITTHMDQSLIGKATAGLGQEHSSVL